MSRASVKHTRKMAVKYNERYRVACHCPCPERPGSILLLNRAENWYLVMAFPGLLVT